MVTLGGANVDRLEEKLNEAACTNDIKAKTLHESKNYLDEMKRSTNIEDISVSLVKMLHCWLEITLSPDHKKLAKRAQYIVTTWRVAIAIHLVIDAQDKHNIKIVEGFANDVATKFNNYTLLYYYWVNLILNNSDETKEKACEIDPVIKRVLTEKLIQDFCSIAHYDSGIGVKNQTLLSKNLPPSLYLGPIDTLHNISINIIKDETYLTQMKLYIGLYHWNEGNRGNGLSNIASGCEYWLNQLSDRVSSNLGADVLLCLASVIEEITSNNLTPAHEFLEIMCDSLQVHKHSSILHYIYYIYLDNSSEEENKKRKETLLEKYPVLAILKDKEFENAIMCENIDLNTKRSLFNELIRSSVDRTFDQADIKPESKLTSTKYAFPVSEKVQQELLDIELLQNMQNKEYSKAVNTVLRSCEQNIFASDVVVMLLVKTLYEQNDSSSLERIRKSFVSFPAIVNDIFQAEIKLAMKKTYALWKEARREIALEDALIQYQSILTNQNDIQSSTIKSALSSVLKYIKLFVEELCYEERNMALDNVENHAKNCFTKFGDASLLVLQWETLFFSHKYSHHILAQEFLKRNSNIIEYIDITKMIDMAVIYKREQFLLELFNISVEYQLSSDAKSRALTALVTHYCDTANKKAINSSLKTASQHKISISDDCLQKIKNTSGTNGLFSKIASYFKSPK